MFQLFKELVGPQQMARQPINKEVITSGNEKLIEQQFLLLIRQVIVDKSSMPYLLFRIRSRLSLMATQSFLKRNWNVLEHWKTPQTNKLQAW